MKRPAPEGSTLIRESGEAESPQEATRPRARTFQDGAWIAGRYRIVRFIAEGSRGEVYAAEDLSLHEHVALKTIRPELASRPDALERFKRELRLARRVTHPHVCRVFDLGEHRGEPLPDGSSQPVAFLTMELLEGPTLYEHLLQHGRMTPAQLLPLARQMASALDAAHAAKIIHRDFKSSNVVLLPPSSSHPEPRVVVTDFGLALETAGEESSSSFQPGAFIGTPSYMSPEQVEGLALSPASDLYSFGVVLYELVTGRLPFQAETPLATALQRLQAAPPPPRAWVPELAPGWDTVLLRCLARRPQDRFATAADVVAALRDAERMASSSLQQGPRQPPAGTAPSPPRRLVAVFTPRSLRARPETDWLATALAELLSAELAASRQVRLLSGEEVNRMRGELSLPETESFARDTLGRIRAHSNVDMVLTGTYLALGAAGASTLRLDLSLQDAMTAETVAHLTEMGPEQDLLALLSRVGTALRKHLGLGPLTSEQALWVRNVIPTHPEAARHYAEGLAALRNHDAAVAVERFDQVVAQEPGFALAWSALAAACQALYLADRAKDAARHAFECSEGLPREESLLIQARHYEMQADWGPAIDAYRALMELSPDSVDYGTALASAQLSAGQPRAARETLAALRQLPPPLGEDPRIDLAESIAAAGTSDFEGSRQYAAAGVKKARAARQWLIVATGLVDEAFAVRNLGNPTSAVELMQEAEQLFLEAGDHGGVIRAMQGRSIALTDLTRLHDAKAVTLRVLERVRRYRGSILEGEVLGNAGWLFCHLGNLDEALRLTRECVLLYQDLGMPTEQAHFSVQLAMVRRHRGELSEAQRLLKEAMGVSRSVGDDYTLAWAHQELGELFTDCGEWSHARQWLESALELRRARGFRAFAIDAELALVRLALEEGRLEEAEARAERAREFYVEQHNRDKEGLAHALRVRPLLLRGEASQALQALAQALSLAGRSENVLIEAAVQLAHAWVGARVGTPAERKETARRLQDFASRAHAGGLKGLELQARLGMAELRQADSLDAARAEFLTIAQEAIQLGYLGITRSARALSRR